ncbi:SDR family NAD(P)-dependent oxidoreductase [Microbacterium sp. NPDC055910]|uniref:SDR family NAD(P)-dependent oxidoreductase n=1 Tax=Microbacterium sp. NPDC055910 TaxID=3345659 RepID=UPI0035E145F1
MTRTVLITGGAGEIGRALARGYADENTTVHLVDVADAVVEAAADVDGVAWRIDLSQADEVARLGEIERLDVLVNGVGYWPPTHVDELTPGEFARYVEINLTSAYSVTWTLRNALRAASGAVVSLSSAIAMKGHADMVHYAAAKAGVLGMTKSLALALGPDGVRVNAVAPGLVSTARNRAVWTPEQQAAFRATRALPVDVEIDDVVQAVRFLASRAARVVTGQTLVVDGGTVMH